MPLINQLGIILCIIWLIGIFLTVYDKLASKRRLRRVPENALFAFAIAGAAFPMLVVMKLIHHKTRHRKFMLGLPAVILVQFIVIILYLISKYIR